MITILFRGDTVRLSDVEAQNLILQITEARANAPAPASKLPPLATKILAFTHHYLELNRAVPSRQQIAEAVGFKDKKSILKPMEDLRLAGWYLPGDGHRSADWGGTYQRPKRLPFQPVNDPHAFFKVASKSPNGGDGEQLGLFI